jgi:hypothetical protein
LLFACLAWYLRVQIARFSFCLSLSVNIHFNNRVCSRIK